MALDSMRPQTGLREQLLADALTPVVRDLKLFEVADLVAFARLDMFPNMTDLINSALELYYNPGVLSFGWAADVNLSWRSPPILNLNMEFNAEGVHCQFRLSLLENSHHVILYGTNFLCEEVEASANTRRLADALERATIDLSNQSDRAVLP